MTGVRVSWRYDLGLGCEIRQVRVNYDRNYDNYDRIELRRRNYDAPVTTLWRSLGLAVGFMKQCCRVLPQAAGQVRRAGA